MYNENRPHLPFNLHRPPASDHPLDVPTPPLMDGSIALSYGKARYKKHESSTRGASVTLLVVELEDALARLEMLPGTFSQVQFAVAHLQRVFLEITAYGFIYHTSMIGKVRDFLLRTSSGRLSSLPS
jgi:hypothetical protein